MMERHGLPYRQTLTVLAVLCDQQVAFVKAVVLVMDKPVTVSRKI